jgi:hypothetical protein
MKKKGILLTAVILFCMAGFVHAQEELGVTMDATWVSKYIWRGFDKFDDKAAFQPSINLDLYGTGLSFGIWTSQPGSSGTGSGLLVGDEISTVNAEEWRYILTYADSVLDGETYQTNYAVSWIYYNFPDSAPEAYDAQEFNLALSWPDICPAGIVPSYTIVKMWPAKSDADVSSAYSSSGWIHVFGLGYDLTVPGFLPDTTEQTFKFIWNITYNDGTGPDVDHDWSHVLWGVSTAIECGPGTFTPAVYYQTSMDDSVNEENEFWAGLSYTVSF